jgi:hypothetical protein
MSLITVKGVSNGVVTLSVSGAKGIYFYGFQQTAATPVVTVTSTPAIANKPIKMSGTSGTRGNLTLMGTFYFLNLNPSTTYSIDFAISENGRNLSKVIANAAAIGSWQSTCIITCEDSGDMDYNDATVAISAFADTH